MTCWPPQDERTPQRDRSDESTKSRRFFCRPAGWWGKTASRGRALRQEWRNRLLRMQVGPPGDRTRETKEVGMYGPSQPSIAGDGPPKNLNSGRANRDSQQRTERLSAGVRRWRGRRI